MMTGVFKMRKQLLNYSFFLFLCFFVSIKAVFAANASLGFSGNSSVYVGNTVTVTLYIDRINGASGGIGSIGGILSWDTSKLQLVGKSNILQVNYNDSNNKFGWVYSGTGLTSKTNIMTFTFKAIATGNANITINQPSVSDAIPNRLSVNVSSKNISIQNPPSGNTNLSSLSVSNGSINFNKNTTNYNLNVDSSVTNINVSASAEDSGAKVSGTGNKTLNYGNNTIRVTVTAPSGATKTYTININRKDSRSSNNSLTNLTVDKGTLSPLFDENTKNYTVLVPYEVESLIVKATAADSKAKVTITDNTNLVSEQTKRVTVTITAENGSIREYYIDVTRGKDPNKPLSDINSLDSLKPNVGILSPVFKKDQLDYKIYVPYEIDDITIDYKLQDTKYGRVEIEKPDNLSVGSNIFKYKVIAENGSIKEYRVNVIRGEGITIDGASDNNYIKEIKLVSGKLNQSFDKDITKYTYKGNLEFDSFLDDENASFKVVEQDKVTYVIVTAENGNNRVYEFKPQGLNIIPIVGISSIMVGTGLGFGLNKLLKSKQVVKKGKKKTKV